MQIPLDPVRAHPHYLPMSASAARGLDLPIRVLVVDDDDDNREMLGLVLEGNGCVVRLAASGREAIAAAAEFVPAVVLTDIGLPDFDGCELARRLREQPSLKACRLVAVTGHTGPEVSKRIEQSGFACCLIKPVSTAALVAAVGVGALSSPREPAP